MVSSIFACAASLSASSMNSSRLAEVDSAASIASNSSSTSSCCTFKSCSALLGTDLRVDMATSGDSAIDREQQNRAYDRRDEARALAVRVPPQRATEHAGEQRTRNTDHHGDHNTARVLTRHDQL